MKIEFKNNKIEKSANDYKRLDREFGNEKSKLIQKALSYLNSSENLNSVPDTIRPHPLKGNRKGYFAVDTKYPYRIIFKPIEDFIITDYSTIKSIEITDLNCDYHDK